jgi:hypothetical protein
LEAAGGYLYSKKGKGGCKLLGAHWGDMGKQLRKGRGKAARALRKAQRKEEERQQEQRKEEERRRVDGGCSSRFR